MSFDYSAHSIGADCPIILHNYEQDLETATREIASILGIKLSKAKEHHSKAIGKKSYNGALFSLRDSETICVEFSGYILNLNNLVMQKHKREINEEQRSAIMDKICVTKANIYETISFKQFFSYSLIKSWQISPLLSEGALLKVLYDAFEYDDNHANNLLRSYLKTGEVSPQLVSIIDKSLVSARKIMAKRISPEWVNAKNNRYDKRQLLSQFKESVEKYLTGNIYHVYYIPLIYRATSKVDRDYVLGFDINKNKMQKLMLKIYDSGRNPLFGYNFNQLNQCLFDAEGNYGEFTEYEKSNLGYTSPLGGGFSEMSPEINEKRFSISAGELEFDSDYYLRFWNNPNKDSIESVISDGMWEMDDSVETCDYSEILVQAMVIEGKPLSKNEISEYSKLFIESLYIEQGKCYFGNFVKFSNGSKDDALKIIGEAISAVLKADNDAIAFIFNDKQSLYAIDRDFVSAPFGRGTELIASFSDCFIYDRNSFVNYDSIINSEIQKIAKYSGFNQKFVHTYSNNLACFEDDDIDFDDIFDIGYTDYTGGYQVKYSTFIAASDFISNLPFDKCRNVYILFCDRESFVEPVLFAGFDNDGMQVLNANLFLSEPYYSNRMWGFMEDLLRRVRLTVSGFYDQWEIEFAYPMINESIMIDPCCTEEEFLLEHTNYMFAKGSLADPQDGHLTKAYVSIPEDMTIEEAELELRKRLPCLAGSKGHRHVKLEHEIPIPYFMASSKGEKWYSAKTTSQLKYSCLPIQRFDVEGVNISVFQETSDSLVFDYHKHFDKESKFDVIGRDIYRSSFVAYAAYSEKVADMYKGKYKVTSTIPVNDLAMHLNSLDDEELVSLRYLFQDS